MAEVWLGLAGELCSPDTPFDHYTTRVGGAPVFPGSAVPWGSSTPKCRVCGSPLSLVLQAYAPLPNLPDRVLLLLGCTKAGCGTSSSCWQAFRCQLPPQQETAQTQQQQTQQQQQQQQDGGHSAQPGAPVQQTAAPASAPNDPLLPAPAAAAAVPAPGTGFDIGGDDWGFGGAAGSGLAGWNNPQAAAAGSSAGGGAGGAFDFSDLTSSLAATVQQQQRHQEREVQRKREQKKQQQSDAAAAAAAAAAEVAGVAAGACGSQDVGSSKGAAGPQLPEFYLLAELEPDASGSKTIPNKELQHVQQLLAAYEATEGATAAAATSTSSSQRSVPPAPAAAAAAAPGSADGAEGDGGVSWAGEEYEPDRVQCMQRSYLKFMKRLARQPQQCARYSHSGPLLWPKAQAPQPTPCPTCGGPRVFEVQLMPALSQMVLEAAGMAQEQGLAVDADVVNAVANWAWCTVAVFTCQGSCGDAQGPTGQCHAVAEEVVVVTEAECESQPGQAAVGVGPPAEAAADQQQDDDDSDG